MKKAALFLGLALICTSCTQAKNFSVVPAPALGNSTLQPRPDTKTKATVVSFYHNTLRGLKTANGELYDPNALTAAHRTLQFGTSVQFFNPKNDANVTVRINDRGPNVRGREFDLSNAAAKQIGITDDGVAILEYRILSLGQENQ